MTYRTNAKPRRRRVVNWGAVGARALRGVVVLAEGSALLTLAVLVIWCASYALTHIGSPASPTLAGAWTGVALAVVVPLVLLPLWIERPMSWYRDNIKRPVFEEREL